MDFMTSVRTVVLEKYADFSGRAQRSEYWWFFLANMILSVVINVLAQVAGFFSIIGLIISLGLLIPGIAVSVRRMHDIGKSGWMLLVGLIPLVGFILLIYWFVQQGTDGDNEFGSDPLK